MVILTDSREQAPLEFRHSYVEQVITRKLLVGDYGCIFNNGFEPPVYFERKSLADLTGTLTSGMERFKKEIERAREHNITLFLIVECTLTKAYDGTKYSKVDPCSIIKTVFTLFVKYGIFPIFCKDREDMAHWIAEYYSAIGRNMLKAKKQVCTADCSTQRCVAPKPSVELTTVNTSFEPTAGVEVQPKDN